MSFWPDIIMGIATLTVGGYCFVLSTRLRRFSTLDSDMGSAIALLSAQVDDMTRALALAGKTAGASVERLDQLTERAEAASARLEVLVAAMHDLPDGQAKTQRFTRRRARCNLARLEAAE